MLDLVYAWVALAVILAALEACQEETLRTWRRRPWRMPPPRARRRP